AIGGAEHRIASFAQRPFQRRPLGRIVLHHQHTQGGTLLGCWWGRRRPVMWTGYWLSRHGNPLPVRLRLVRRQRRYFVFAPPRRPAGSAKSSTYGRRLLIRYQTFPPIFTPSSQ